MNRIEREQAEHMIDSILSMTTEELMDMIRNDETILRETANSFQLEALSVKRKKGKAFDKAVQEFCSQ